VERILEIAFLICGIEIHQPYEGASLSVTAQEVEHRGKHLSNCIHLQYRASVAPDATLSEQEYINRVLLEERNLLLESLSLLLSRPSQLLVHKAKLDGVDVELRLPPQKFPAGLYNLMVMWGRPLMIEGYSSLVDNDGWPVLETLVREFRQKPTVLRRSLVLPLRWFARGADELDSTDRLVAFWISFNALYEDTDKREQEAIRSYIQTGVNSAIAQRYVNTNERSLQTLASYPIELGRRRKRPIAQELTQSLNASPRDYATIVEVAALTIYGIRNTLFHGGCDPDSANERERIGVAERLLSRLVKELIAKQMLGYPLPKTRFVIEEKWSQ
jgi:hypothetical protein